MAHKMNHYPLEDCARTAAEQVAKGHNVYQKWQCDKCDTIQTIEEPNKFYTSGKCEECGHITDMLKKGCNYMLVARNASIQDIVDLTKKNSSLYGSLYFIPWSVPRQRDH